MIIIIVSNILDFVLIFMFSFYTINNFFSTPDRELRLNEWSLWGLII